MPHSGIVILVFEATSPIAVLVQLLFGISTAKMSSEDKVASELTLTHSFALNSTTMNTNSGLHDLKFM